jgi:hypothetical protein
MPRNDISGIINAIKQPQVALLIVVRYVRNPFAGGLVPTDTLHTRLVVFPKPMVAGVFLMSRQSKVCYSIVCPVSVYVIDLHAGWRHGAIRKKPRYVVRAVSGRANPKKNIPVAGFRGGNAAFPPTWSSISGPVEQTTSSVVSEVQS